LVDELVVFLMS